MIIGRGRVRELNGKVEQAWECEQMNSRLMDARLMRVKWVVAGCALLGVVGCASGPDGGVDVLQVTGLAAGTAGAVMTGSELGMLTPEYLAGVLIAYAIYDPLAPNWTINARRIDEDLWRIDLRMKRLITGGEGEASRIFRRSARQIAEAAGAREFEVLRYEEGLESTRPFAQRYASGDIRALVRPAVQPVSAR